MCLIVRRMLRTGGGGASLRMARQRMSFNSSSSISSASSKSMLRRPRRRGRGRGLRSSSGCAASPPVRRRVRAVAWKAADMGRAPASKCVIGRRPRINSMVRSIEVVLYIVLSTTWRFTYGEITNAGERCESTWSGPFCASSSSTKIAVLRPETSLRDPFHRSCQRVIVVGRSGERRDLARRVPEVWSLPRRMNISRGMLPDFSNSASSCQENLGALHVRIVQVEAAETAIGHLGQHRIAHAGDLLAAGRGIGLVVDQVAVVAHGDSGRGGVGPEIAGGRRAAASCLRNRRCLRRLA